MNIAETFLEDEKTAGDGAEAAEGQKNENLGQNHIENLGFAKDIQSKIAYLIIPISLTAKNQLKAFLKLHKKDLSLTWRGGQKINGKWSNPTTMYHSVPEEKKDDLLKAFKNFGIPVDEIEFQKTSAAAPPTPKHIKEANRIADIGDQYEEAIKDYEAKEKEEIEIAESLYEKGIINQEDLHRQREEIKARYAKNISYLKDKQTRNHQAADVIYEEGEKRLKSGIGEPTDPDQVVAELNKNFAIVETPQFGIMEIGIDKILMHKKNDILDRFQNKVVVVGQKGGDEPKPIYKTKAELWLESEERNTYYTIDFRPEKPPGEFIENGKRIYNSWAGLSVKPKKGCCRLFKNHMLEVICAGDKNMFDYLWKLNANWVQKPWERTCAIVLRGPQGIGKGAYTEIIGKLFGAAYFLTNEHEQVFGRFNAALMGKVLIHLDEALFGGDRRIIGRVKGLITGPQFPIEMKNRDPIPMNNPRKVMISSNESFAIPVDADDRRFLFLDVSVNRAGDDQYFNKIFEETNGGGIEALLADLLETDLSGFNPRILPSGAQKFGFDNKLASSNSFVQFLCLVLREGTFNLESTSGWTDLIRTDLLQEYYLAFCGRRRLRSVVDEQVGKELLKILGSAGILRSRKRFDKILKYAYEVPDLKKCRDSFALHFKTTADLIFGEE